MKPAFATVSKFRIPFVAFTPKGGCPLKPERRVPKPVWICLVAFTPKGGCPFKHALMDAALRALLEP